MGFLFVISAFFFFFFFFFFFLIFSGLFFVLPFFSGVNSKNFKSNKSVFIFLYINIYQ
jgi:hypothetical protein